MRPSLFLEGRIIKEPRSSNTPAQSLTEQGNIMKTTKLGTQGPQVSAIGLGSLSMGRSGPFGASQDDEGIRTIHEAIERGVTLIDTGDFYGSGENEMLVGR